MKLKIAKSFAQGHTIFKFSREGREPVSHTALLLFKLWHPIEVQAAPEQELLVFWGSTCGGPEHQPDWTSQSHMMYHVTNHCFQRNAKAKSHIPTPEAGEVRTFLNKNQGKRKWILMEQILCDHCSHVREMWFIPSTTRNGANTELCQGPTRKQQAHSDGVI